MYYPICCTVGLGGVALRLHLHFQESAAFFALWETKDDPAAEVCMTEDEWAYMMKRGFALNVYNETSLLTAYCSDALLPYDRCVFHAVALRCRDRAWIIAAASGVGKSTQARFLQELWPGEFSVICGDRPVLQLTEDGGVMAHPSPWNGKEGWHGATAAPLAGIVFLQRGNSNEAYSLKRHEAALHCLASAIHTGIAETDIRQTADFISRLLERVPCYLLQSDQVPDSTRLLYDRIIGKEDAR